MNANGRIHEGEMPSGESSSTETIRLVGRGFKIPIRSLPTAQGIVTNYLYAGDTIVVKISDSKNFYRLADDSVISFKLCSLYMVH